VIGGTASDAPRFDFVTIDAPRFDFDAIKMLSGFRHVAPSAPEKSGVSLLVELPVRIRFLAPPETFPTTSCRFRDFFGKAVCFQNDLLAKYISDSILTYLNARGVGVGRRQ
jgi:hypothetical protein